jgi:hypothetical protein
LGRASAALPALSCQLDEQQTSSGGNNVVGATGEMIFDAKHLFSFSVGNKVKYTMLSVPNI